MKKISWTKRSDIMDDFWSNENVITEVNKLANNYSLTSKQIARVIQSWDMEEDTYWQQSYKDLAVRVHNFRKLAKEYLDTHLSSKTVRYNQSRQIKEL